MPAPLADTTIPRMPATALPPPPVTIIARTESLPTRRIALFTLPPARRTALVTAPPARPVAPFILPSPLPARLLTLSLLRQQQRSRTLQQARQRCCDLDGRHFVLSLKLFDDRPKRSSLPGSQCIGDTLFEPRNPLLVDRRNRRQIHLRNLLPCCALDDAQHVPLARSDEQNRLTTASRATRPSNSVDV
jgi:hypothetical protein